MYNSMNSIGYFPGIGYQGSNYLQGLLLRNYAIGLLNAANILMGPLMSGPLTYGTDSTTQFTENYPGAMANSMDPLFNMPALPEQQWMQYMMTMLQQMIQQLYDRLSFPPFDLSSFFRPRPPADDQFDNVINKKGSDDVDDIQVDLGTPGKDKIIQEGLGGNDTQYAAGLDSNDWIWQQGGAGNDKQTGKGGSGDDVIRQDGGAGDDTITAEGNLGDDKIFQYGDAGKDTIEAQGGDGNDYIYQEGGAGDDTLKAFGGLGDDTIKIYGGQGNDTITYDLSAGNDNVYIDGGQGNKDKVTINALNNNFTLVDNKGKVLYKSGEGGSTITVANLESVIVIGQNNTQLYPPVATA